MIHDLAKLRLGKRAARHDPRTLKLASFLTPLPTPHPRIDWSLGVNDWGMMKNDALGDCTIATVGHLIQAWTNNNGAELVLPDSTIVAEYSAVTGYVPGDESTDNGAVELDVLNYWRTKGIGGHKIAGYVAVDPKNRDHLRLACDLFGGVYLGVGLPVSAQVQEVWAVPDTGPVGDGSPGSWGGHAIPMVNYGPAGAVVVTWGALKTATWEWLTTYCDEAYACLSEDWVEPGKQAPSGLDLAGLQAALKAIG
jgi:hypothetical protein